MRRKRKEQKKRRRRILEHQEKDQEKKKNEEKEEETKNNNEIVEQRKEENIDYWHICNAYETIDKWFNFEKHNETTLINFKKYFDENVKVIWYEVSTDEDSIALFTRLNIGKIPLTSAELVKAMFLCNEGGAKGTACLSQI